MEAIRNYVQENIVSIALVLAVLVGIGAFFCWAGSGKETDYPIVQRLQEATNFAGVELTPAAKSNCTENIFICFNTDGSGAVLSGKDLERSGLYVREIRHELKDQELYAPEFWQEMEKRRDNYNTIFVIDSTK